MKEVLVDTDILSYYFRGDPTVVESMLGYYDFFEKVSISQITYFEVLSGLLFKDARNQIKLFERFVNENNVLPLTEGSLSISAALTAKLRKAGFALDNLDVLIAGIAMERDLVLVTNNEKHFSRIADLEILNWKKQ